MASKVVHHLLKKPFLPVFLLTFALRLWVLGKLTASLYFSSDEGDVKFYNDWALSILRGQWTDHQAFYGLPGYAYFIAIIYKILGYSPFYLSVFQAALEGVVSILIVKIAILICKDTSKPHFGPVAGILAAVGYAFFVPAQTFSAILMPTSILVCAFWLVVWWSMRTRRHIAGALEATGTGMLIGCMAMMVATIFFAIPIALAGLLREKRESLAKKLLNGALLLLGVVLGCSPAILHNRLIAHDSVFLSAHGGVNFYAANQPGANGYLKVPDGLRAGQAGMLADSIQIATTALGGSPDHPIKRSAVSKYWSNKASAYIHDHPGEWIRLEGQKILNFWNAHQYDDLSLVEFYSEEGITTPGLRFGLVAALGLAGILSLFSCFPKSRWVTAAIFLHMASLLPVFITERYRMAVVPGLLILGALAVIRLWDAFCNGEWKTGALLASLMVGTTLFVTIPSPDHGIWGLDAYNAGVRALKNHQLDLATGKLQLAWRYSPANDQVNFALGNLYLEKNDSDQAKVFYRRTLELNPKHSGAMNNLGYIALQQKMPGIAIRFLSLSLQLAPEDAKTWYMLGSALWENKQPADALRAVQKAISLRPNEKTFQDLLLKIQTASPAI